jgi:hypothetical protein
MKVDYSDLAKIGRDALIDPDGVLRDLDRGMVRAIAAVAPLIAKAERERCADVAERFGVVAHGALETEPWAVQQQAGREISAAVRALPDA